MAVKHNIRTAAGGIKRVTLTARGAIRANCRECMGFNAQEVKHCTSPLCPSFPFRSSGKPKDSPKLTP